MDTDAAFFEAFEQGKVPNAAFHHRDHVRLTWLYLRRDGPEAGAANVADAIRRFATTHGAADRFHVTLTRFWVRLVQHVMETFPSTSCFEDLLAAFPLLADKSAVYRHYSRERLAAREARLAWVSPDVRPLP